MKKSPLSELEGAVLGVVWTLESCTAYTVRKVFRDSPTTNWSASAGAIYPLMQRLEGRGILESQVTQQGKRTSCNYRLTRAGLSLFRDWIGPPMPKSALSLPPDPLRSRLRFLGALPPTRRPRLVDQATRELTQQIVELEELLLEAEASGDKFWKLAVSGGLMMARARVELLDEMRMALEEGG